MGTISLDRFDVPDRVFGRGGVAPIRQDQFLAVFDVTVDLNGCYVIVVRLVEDNSETATILTFGTTTSFDRTIAANTSAQAMAYCFDQGRPRTFSIAPTTPPAPGQAPLQPPGNAVALAPLEGFWPKSEVGSEIEVRLEVDVYLIRPRPCGPDSDCPVTAVNGLRDTEPRVQFQSGLVDIELIDGDDPAVNALRMLGTQGAKAALGFARPGDAESGDGSRAFALIASELSRQRRRARRLQASLGDLRGRLPELERVRVEPQAG
ncbi:MAG: hypothetical protein R2712_21090 [Vicinamibacterales bacterium]